ncbi:MAG: hypothetical protein ACJAZ3_002083 [Sphingobacteriales bacterium]|jgi:hypothetical protein
MLEINEQTLEPHIEQQCVQVNVNWSIMKYMSNCIAQTTQLHSGDALVSQANDH